MSNLPLKILERHGSMTLAIEVMAINKTPFVITTSCNIHFGMPGLVQGQNVKQNHDFQKTSHIVVQSQRHKEM